MRAKTDRNLQIYAKVKANIPYRDILRQHRLKSKKSIYNIVKSIEVSRGIWKSKKKSLTRTLAVVK